MMSLPKMMYRCARHRPDAVATEFLGRSHNWAEFVNRVESLGAGLRELSGNKVCHIGILALNSDKYLESLFAIACAGSVMVPLNTRWAEAENKYALDDSQTSILLFDDAFAEQALSLQASLPSLDKVVYMGEHSVPEGSFDYEALIENSEPALASSRGGADMAGIFYTGGTTGFPKGVMQSHQAIWASAVGSVDLLGIHSDAIYCHTAPMFHVADLAGSMSTILSGGSHRFMANFEPGALLDAIVEQEISHTLLVPAMIKALLQHPDIGKARRLERIMYGASPMPAAVLKQALELLPNTGFVQAYGQTELAPIVSILSAEDHQKGGDCLSSAGKPTIINDVRIVDEQGTDCLTGTPGEVVVSGPHTMLGYWNNPEQTAAALRDGWVYTGDAAIMDDDGFIYIVDRVKDMVVTGGENVFTTEVENALISHPAVLDVAVIGVPHEDWGEAVHAIIIPAGEQDPSLDEMLVHARPQIAGYKCPKSMSVRREPFPLSGAGKVLKTELRAPFWEGRERKI